MRSARRLAWLAAPMLLVVACGGSDAPSVSEDPAASAEGLLDGVPGDCRLLEDHDPELHASLLALVDPGIEHGPLVVALGEELHVLAATTYERPGVEGASAAWVVEDDAVVTFNAEAERISSAARRDDDASVDDAAVVAEAEDCSLVAADRSVEDPPAPEPEMRPDLLVIEPEAAPPGTQLALRFPEETSRGIAFTLDRRTADGWETTHWMTSDANGDRDPDTIPAGSEGFAVEDVGVGGPGPDHVRLPEELEPGEYRVCTANAVTQFCAPLTVTDG